jgi:hypothetical protein
MHFSTPDMLFLPALRSRSASSKQHGSQYAEALCSWWSVTSKQNLLTQTRVIRATGFDAHYHQNV